MRAVEIGSISFEAGPTFVLAQSPRTFRRLRVYT